MNVRMARLEDSAALLKIYAQYIDSPVTFERVLPSEREFAARIGRIAEVYPYLVCQGDHGNSRLRIRPQASAQGSLSMERGGVRVS